MVLTLLRQEGSYMYNVRYRRLRDDISFSRIDTLQNLLKLSAQLSVSISIFKVSMYALLWAGWMFFFTRSILSLISCSSSSNLLMGRITLLMSMSLILIGEPEGERDRPIALIPQLLFFWLAFSRALSEGCCNTLSLKTMLMVSPRRPDTICFPNDRLRI